jgi:hypothetical protein
MMKAEVVLMRRRILCLLLVLSLSVSCCACNMRGSTEVLIKYPAQKLYDTYIAIQDGSLKVQVPRTETIPELHTTMMQSPEYYDRMASLYFYNDSSYYLTIHGYAWIAESTDLDDAHQAIYFNNEKNVANANYEIRLDPGNNTYLLYEVLFVPKHSPTIDSVYFLFFRYEDTEYAGAATAENEFVFWPLSQTLE